MEKELHQDVEDLKIVIDQLLINSSVTFARLKTLQSMILGTLEELFSEEAYKNICRHYLSLLEENTNEALAHVEGVLFDPGSKVLKTKFEVFSDIRSMKSELGIDGSEY